MQYVVELTADDKTNRKSDLNRDGVYPASFDDARGLLTDFVEAHGGKFLGWFNDKGETRVGSALVEITDETAEALEAHNVELLFSKDQNPFVSRVTAEIFDISKANGIKTYGRRFKGAGLTA